MRGGSVAPWPARLLARLPLRLLHLLGALGGLLVWWLPNRHRRVTLRNVALCFPELSAAERRRLARRSLVETGKTLAEMPRVWFGAREAVLGLIREVQGEELLERALASGGVVAVTPHLGNWELAGLYLSARFGGITSLYRPPRREGLAPLLRHARERFGAQLVPTDASGVRSLYRTLREGRLAGLLPDQEPRSGGAFAPFFGRPALTMTLLPRLLHKSGAAVVFGFAERLPQGRGFRIRYFAAPAGLAAADPAAAAAALNRGVEQCVRARPEQYMWSYKRFKSRPEGEGAVY